MGTPPPDLAPSTHLQSRETRNEGWTGTFITRAEPGPERTQPTEPPVRGLRASRETHLALCPARALSPSPVPWAHLLLQQ